MRSPLEQLRGHLTTLIFNHENGGNNGSGEGEEEDYVPSYILHPFHHPDVVGELAHAEYHLVPRHRHPDPLGAGDVPEGTSSAVGLWE